MAEGCINLLLNTKDTSELFAPLPSARIKYACIATSSQHIALGANSGGVYCFSRDTLKYVQLLTNKEGTVSQVKFSLDGSWLAVVTGGGHVALWEFNAHKVPPWQRCHVSSLLKDATVKALQWDSKAARLFYGDDLGRVVAIPVPKLSIVFKLPDEIVYQAKESIVQIDVYQDTLLISTTQQCILYRLLTKKVVQVGTKGRDGAYGACFDARWKDRPPVIFSARPGGRVWEADIEGTVLSTLKLKEFVTIPSSPILGPSYVPDFSQLVKTPTQALNFCSLLMFNRQYLVGWQEGVLFIFNPSTYTLTVWTADLPSILDVCTDHEELVVLYGGGRRVGLLGVATLQECVQTLAREKLLAQGVELLCHYSTEATKLLSTNKEMIPSLQTLLESVAQGNFPSSLLPLRDLLPKRDPLPPLLHGPSPLPLPPSRPVATEDVTRPGPGDEVLGKATYQKSPERGTEAMGDDGTVDQLPKQQDNLQVVLLPWQQDAQLSEQKLDLELEGTLPGMGSKDQASIGPDRDARWPSLDGQSEELFVPLSPVQDVVEGGAGRPGVGVVIQQSRKGTLSVVMETSKGELPSSVPTARESPLLQLDPKGTEGSEGITKVTSSVPDRMTFALQAAASVDDDDDVVAVPVRSGSGVTAASKHKGQKKRKKGSRKNSDASDSVGMAPLATPPLATSPLPAPPPAVAKEQDDLPVSAPHTSPVAAVPSIIPPSPSPTTHDASLPIQSPGVQDLIVCTGDEVDHPTLEQGAGQKAESTEPTAVLLPMTDPTSQVLRPEKLLLAGTLPASSQPEKPAISASISQPLTTQPDRSLQHAVMETPSGVESIPLKPAGVGRRGSNGGVIGEAQLRKVKEFFTAYVSACHTLGPCATPTLDPGQRQEGAEDDSTLAFLKATTKTMDQLEDLNVICSSDSLRAVLTEWLQQLEVFSGHRLSAPPLPRPSEGAGQAGLECPAFGGLPSRHRGVARWLVSLCLDLGVLGTQVSVEGFVARYWPLLDLSRAKVAVARHDLATRCCLWRRLAQDMQGPPGEKLAIPPSPLPISMEEMSRTDLSWMESLPGYLLSVLRLEAPSFAPFCAAAYPYVLPWEVIALLCESELVTNPDPSHLATPTAPPSPPVILRDQECRELLALYFDLLCAEGGGGGRGSHLTKMLKGDPEVALVGMEALMSVRPPLDQLKTQDGQPVPWSHLVAWRYGHTLEVVSSVFTPMCPAHLRKACLLSKEQGYWKGYLQLSLAAKDTCLYLTAALALRDMRLLTEAHTDDGPLLRTIGDWKLLLQLMAKVEPVATTMSSMGADLSLHEVTWAGVLRHALASLGPVILTKLLSEVDLSLQSSKLAPKLPHLHSTLVELIAVHTQQRAIAHHLLESVDHYLWSSRPAVLGPQALYIHKHPEVVTSEQVISSANSRVRTIEDATHWGRKAWLEPGSTCVCCGICRLPVVKPIAEHGHGILTFPCGHTYHSQCLPELVCLLCFVEHSRRTDGAVCSK